MAEDVEKVNPALVVCDEKGKAYTMRYAVVNTMVLNEFLKAQRKAEEQEAMISELKTGMAEQRQQFDNALAKQRKAIEALAAHVKDQKSQIQNVSAQLEVRAPLSQLALNQ